MHVPIQKEGCLFMHELGRCLPALGPQVSVSLNNAEKPQGICGADWLDGARNADGRAMMSQGQGPIRIKFLYDTYKDRTFLIVSFL
jgi:hypothetical protein